MRPFVIALALFAVVVLASSANAHGNNGNRFGRFGNSRGFSFQFGGGGYGNNGFNRFSRRAQPVFLGYDRFGNPVFGY